MRSYFIVTIVFLAFLTSAQAQTTSSKDNVDNSSVMSMGLGSLPLLNSGQTRSISAENPTGGKGKGYDQLALPSDPFIHLSATEAKDWKLHPFLAPKAHQTVTLMDVDGPGVIQHMWMVSADAALLYHGRGCILRIYWDGETTPSVEAPVSDFFAVGHDTFAPVNSLPVVDNGASAFNSFWPMPFRKHARITFTNDTDQDEFLLAYQITYAVGKVPSNAAYFHAQYRQGSWAAQNPYVIVDGIRGRGRYVGTVFEVAQKEDLWFGEGEVQFYIDGDTKFPTIAGTGTEDYFLSSYGFPHTMNGLYSGVPLGDNVMKRDPSGTAGSNWTLYRWHIMDPINFQKDLKIQIEGLGPRRGIKGNAKRKDDLNSVAFWYQTEPHAPFPPLPSLAERTSDPLADFPVSIFDLKQAKVTDADQQFTWQDCGAGNTVYQKLHSGYRSPTGSYVCVGAAMMAGQEGQSRGFDFHLANADETLSSEWPVVLTNESEFRLDYGIAGQGAPLHLLVTAIMRNGDTLILFQKTLEANENTNNVALKLPAEVQKLRFEVTQTKPGVSPVFWIHPVVE
jgi:hypothetical protein